MSGPITEICIVTLVPGSTPTDPSSSAGKAIATIAELVSAQPGVRRIHWGQYVENSDNAQLMIDWDSLQAHDDFIACPAYAKVHETLGPFLAAKPDISHAYFTEQLPVAILEAPVVELFTAYLPAATSAADKAAFEAKYHEFIAAGPKPHAAGYLGEASGWRLEETERPEVEGKLTAFVAALAWESVEAHLQFRETPGFKDNAALLGSGHVAIELHHVKFQKAK